MDEYGQVPLALAPKDLGNIDQSDIYINHKSISITRNYL